MFCVIRGLCLSCLIFFLDLLSKYWAKKTLIPYDSVALSDFFNWTLVFNTGSAFSLFASTGAWHVFFLDAVSVLMCCLIFGWMLRKKSQKIAFEYYGAALILGGALGNLSDRLRFQYVIDFIDVHYQQYHWPIFNIADCAITIGVGLFLLISIKRIK